MPSESPSAILENHAEHSSLTSQHVRVTSIEIGENPSHRTSINPEKNPSPSINSIPSSPTHSNVPEISAVVLHIILIVIHVILLVVLLTRLESRIVMPLTEGSGLASTIIVVVSQIFVIVCYLLPHLPMLLNMYVSL
jgi:small-conductance mechanosensitive channel